MTKEQFIEKVMEYLDGVDSIEDCWANRALDIINNAPSDEEKTYAYSELSQAAQHAALRAEHVRAMDDALAEVQKSVNELYPKLAINLSASLDELDFINVTVAGAGHNPKSLLFYMLQNGLPEDRRDYLLNFPDYISFTFGSPSVFGNSEVYTVSSMPTEDRQELNRLLNLYFAAPLCEKTTDRIGHAYRKFCDLEAESRLNRRYNEKGLLL